MAPATTSLAWLTAWPLLASPKNVADQLSEIADVEAFGKALPHIPAGFATQPGRLVACAKGLKCLGSPKELGDRHCVQGRTHARSTGLNESRSRLGWLGANHAPPIGYQTQRRRHVTVAGHEPRPVKHLRVGQSLALKPCERVLVTLDLPAVQVTVDDGEIDATRTLAEAKLVADQSVSTS
jgi:hypothetical protein